MKAWPLVNLRGLGASRTLVLLNGRRHVSTETDGVDTSAFPISAIGRVEVLEDGAAALYGSDAIAGVANSITRSDYQGLKSAVLVRTSTRLTVNGISTRYLAPVETTGNE